MLLTEENIDEIFNLFAKNNAEKIDIEDFKNVLPSRSLKESEQPLDFALT